MTPPCGCLAVGPRFPDAIRERQVGVDGTEGRFADVEVIKCKACDRLWLRYHVEYESFSRSGRWAAAVIDDEMARHVSPEQASDFIAAQAWYVFGGSYWGHAGQRGQGPLRWRL